MESSVHFVFILKTELRVIREGGCEVERILRAALLGEAGFVPYVSFLRWCAG